MSAERIAELKAERAKMTAPFGWEAGYNGGYAVGYNEGLNEYRQRVEELALQPSLPEGAREALERARRFIQAVMGDVKFKVTDRDHVSLLQSAIDDIQTALAPTPSSAGLIEAAEMADEEAENSGDINEHHEDAMTRERALVEAKLNVS